MLNPFSAWETVFEHETTLSCSGVRENPKPLPLTSAMLARWIGAPLAEVTYTCAGINHQGWSKAILRPCMEFTIPLLGIREMSNDECRINDDIQSTTR